MEDQEEKPKWLVELENRKKKSQLAHETGAGALCLTCKSACPGLDLHFWRKICKNCKCRGDDHDVNDNEFPQFELLFGPRTRNKRQKSVLLKVQKEHQVQTEDPFEWIPPNTTNQLASDYMSALPLEKMPIKGSVGAIVRRQQLQKQIPLHDIDCKACDHLSDQEKKEFIKYLDTLKECAGQGRVSKLMMIKPFDKSLTTPVNATDVQQFSPQRSQLKTFAGLQLRTPSSFLSKSGKTDSPHSNKVDKEYTSSSAFHNTLRNPICEKIFAETTEVGKLSPLVSEMLCVNDASNRSPYQPENTDEERTGIKSNKNDDIQNVPYKMNVFPYSQLQTDPDTYHSPHSFAKAIIEEDSNEPCSSLNSQNDSVNITMHNAQVLRNPPSQVASIEDVEILKGEPNQLPPNQEILHESPAVRNDLKTTSMQSLILEKLPKETDKSNILEEKFKSSLEHTNAAPQSPKTVNSERVQAEFDSSLSIQSQVSHSVPLNYSTFPLEASIDTTAMQHNLKDIDQVEQETEGMTTNTSEVQQCHKCKEDISSGGAVVCADKMKNAVWHPACFVCNTCNELLVDLVYFTYKNKLFCARDLADHLKVPRCYACDELIFVREYTVAEGHNYHVNHFCCWDCDIALAGHQYVIENERPLCLSCYQNNYAKKCDACELIIAAEQQGIAIKNLNFHATNICFCCANCKVSLLDGQFAVREKKLLCSKECIAEHLRAKNQGFNI